MTSFLAGWLSLWLMGVRPAWRVAVLTGILFWVTGELSDRALAGDLPVEVLPLTSATVSALAAVLTEPRPLLWRPRIALLIVLALLFPLSSLMGDQRAEASRRSELTDAGVPLLAPDTAGYRLEYQSVTRYSHQLAYLLWPERADVDASDLSWAVHVTVAPVKPGFHPPVCDALDSSGSLNNMPCEQITSNTWRTIREHAALYFVRRDGFVTVLTSYGPHITHDDLRTLAATLAVRDPGYFLH
ncbi:MULTISPECIES: hypothetical protein [Streptomyces]|uniref:Uncharacterized protein n=1 Tax=Streptomyces ehimensis TaxID=68195 RepID=A0ABV9BQT1_9ACTN